MERIQFFTPHDDSPKGKNYVFFAAHPDDKEQYFDILKKDITDIEDNCAFLLDSQPDQPWEDSLTNWLTETGIQLFVFPVTSKLLYSENSAISVLLPYACEKNIPIIPIMLEPDLESQYECVFGQLQYMDKVTKDYTTIPYEEKLKRFLLDVLVSKETAAKIRQAFDAYIFLSYRKKDRALAVELIKLIHEIPQMRDVAIWYDEFLVPGENFNANITKALAKSDLFAMAVTPNLLDEGNYVLKYEYPYAKDAGIPVLPAQMAEADPNLFFQTFRQELPGVIDAYNTDMLKDALFGGLKHIALAQNNDPMHNYLIGLAYVNGIDVETNHTRGLKLITAAAENGCPDAMKDLANMYFVGNVVSRDLEQATHWQTKYVNCCKQLFTQTDDMDSKMKYVHALAGLGQVYESGIDVVAACNAYTEAIDLMEAISEPTSDQKLWLCGLLENIGRLLCNSDDRSLATEYLMRSITLWEDLTQEQENAQRLRRYAGSLMLVGASILETADPITVYRLYMKAYDLCNRAIAISHDDYTVRYAAGCNTHIGTILMHMGQFPAAQKILLESNAQFLELAQKTGNPRHYADFARAKIELGKCYTANEKYDEAADAFQIAISVYEHAFSNTKDLVIEQNLCAVYTLQAEAYLGASKQEEAKAILEKAYNHSITLCEKGNAPIIQSGLSKIYLILGKISLAEEKTTAAEEYFQKAVDHHLDLCSQSDSPSLRDELHHILITRTEALYERGLWRLAKRYCRANKDIANKMIDQWHMLQGYRLLRDTHICLRKIYSLLGDVEQEKLQWNTSIEYAEKVAACSDVYTDRLQLSDMYRELSAWYESQGDSLNALLVCQKSVENLELIHTDIVIPAVSIYRIRELSHIAVKLSKNHIAAAMDAQREAVEEARILAQETDDPDNQLILANCLWSTGYVESGMPEDPTATEALTILRNLCKQHPRNMEYREKLNFFNKQWKKLQE